LSGGDVSVPLETEVGGIEVYETALKCVRNDDLKEEFEKYHEQTQHHEEVVREMLESLGLDPEKETPGRTIVRKKGKALVAALELWIQFLGMPAVLPPPEDEKDVESAIGAARAKQERSHML
jgi:rubrerythrin